MLMVASTLGGFFARGRASLFQIGLVFLFLISLSASVQAANPVADDPSGCPTSSFLMNKIYDNSLSNGEVDWWKFEESGSVSGSITYTMTEPDSRPGYAIQFYDACNGNILQTDNSNLQSKSVTITAQPHATVYAKVYSI